MNHVYIKQWPGYPIYTEYLTILNLLSRPSEEIFVVLNFVPGLNLVLANAHTMNFSMAAELSVKTMKFAPCES